MNMGYHFEIIRDTMRGMSKVGSGLEQFSADAIAVALLSNAYNDIFQEEFTELAINDLLCRFAKPVVERNHYDKLNSTKLILSYSRKLLLNTLDSIEKAYKKDSQLNALLAIGLSLHIVCDFYAHSNWVELEMPRYLKSENGNPVKDATFYDMLGLGQNGGYELAHAITENRTHRLLRFEGEKKARIFGLYSHGNSKTLTPDHAHLNKDYAGRPHFEWAYRAAYKASIQHLLLIHEYVKKLPDGDNFWNSLVHYILPDNIKRGVKEATNFDKGTIRWMTTYGGAWKHGRRWSTADILADDLPNDNVEGIGLFATAIPPIWRSWHTVAMDFSDGLFEAYDDKSVRAFSKEKYIAAWHDFQESGGMSYENRNEFFDQKFWLELVNGKLPDFFSKLLESPLLQALEQGSYELLDIDELPDYNDDRISNTLPVLSSINWNECKWIRVQIPFVADLDTGSGWLNINNEEPGGKSDFWVKFEVDGQIYTEAEYVDQSHPHTNWQVLIPRFNNNPVDVKIVMYESDPTNHKDETMDIRPGDGKSLEFSVLPDTGKVTCGTDGVEIMDCPTGSYLRSCGSGDLKAKVLVVASVLSDTRVEFAVKATSDRGVSKRDFWALDTLAITGGYAWHLSPPLIQEKTLYDHFTIDPGRYFKPDFLADFRLVLLNSPDFRLGLFRPANNASPILLDNATSNLEHAAVRCETVEHAGFFPSDYSFEDVGTMVQVSNSADIRITAKQSEEIVETLSVITFTGTGEEDGTSSKVELFLYDSANRIIGHYRLDNFDTPPFQSGHADFFWLGNQHLNGFDAQHYSGKIKNIAKVKIQKVSGDDLKLEQFEIFSNGHLIARSQEQINLTNASLYWEKALSYPKEIRWLDLPKVTCSGRKQLSSKSSVLSYKVEGCLQLVGFDQNASIPGIHCQIIPGISGATHTSYGYSASSGKLDITSHIDVSRKLNYNFNYQWIISIPDPASNNYQPIIKTARFEIPRPYVELFEKSFSGGDELITVNGKSRLRFTGSYEYQCHNWGIENPLLFNEQILVEPVSARGGIEKDLEDIRFERPYDSQEPWPYIPEYRLRLRVKDTYDIFLEDARRVIKIPTLAAEHIVRYREKTCSYFDTGADIKRIPVDHARYDTYAQQFKEVRAEYAFADIRIIPYLERDDSVYSYKIFDPEFEWDLPRFVFIKYGVLPAESNGTSVSKLKLPSIPNQFKEISGKVTITNSTKTLTDQILKEINETDTLAGPSIWVSLDRIPLEGDGALISCVITDGVQQRCVHDLLLKPYIGLSLENINKLRTLYAAKQAIVRYAELVPVLKILEDNFWMIDLTNPARLPDLHMDPLPQEILTETDTQLFERYNRLKQLYEINGGEVDVSDSDFQSQLTRLLDVSFENLPKLDMLSEVDSLKPLQTDIGSAMDNLQKTGVQIRTDRVKSKVVISRKLLDGLNNK